MGITHSASHIRLVTLQGGSRMCNAATFIADADEVMYEPVCSVVLGFLRRNGFREQEISRNWNHGDPLPALPAAAQADDALSASDGTR